MLSLRQDTFVDSYGAAEDAGDQPPSWSFLEDRLPVDIVAFVRAFPTGGNIGARRFFNWVLTSPTEHARWMLNYLLAPEREIETHAPVTGIRNAILSWQEELFQRRALKSATIRQGKDRLVSALCEAGADERIRFPRVFADMFPTPAVNDAEPHPCLAMFDWPEFIETPEEGRDEHGIRLVRAHALEVFQSCEEKYDFGQLILEQTMPSHPSLRAEWLALRALLKLEIASWTKERRSIFSRPWSQKTRERMAKLKTRETWVRLGLKLPSGGDSLATNVLTNLIVSCVGPTFCVGQALQAIFCCDSGWNRRPIQSLPQSPFVFRTDRIVKLGSEKMMTNFKARAGHFVFADASQAEIFKGIAAQNIEAKWSASNADVPVSRYDEVLDVEPDSELLSLMARYSRLTSGIRPWCGENTQDLFFIALSQRFRGGIVAVDREIGALMPDGILTRPGVTFSTVRKSFLNAVDRQVDSSAETRAVAGQVTPSILQRNYRTDPFSVAEYELPVRFVQNCAEAIILPDGLAVKLRFNDKQRAWFKKLALVSGIASACGIALAPSSAVDDDFVFNPTPDNLLDLYFAHRSLKKQRLELPPGRWEIQGQIMLGIVKGIGRTLFSKGLACAYVKAARAGNEMLRSGYCTLTPVLEV
ncbi:hypothetical protein [Rhizobium leguminosarum]|uniref:hypothetical protein n=1 Tax=Rhizobium leguminosarum TaxID=384 RepID=UPI00035ED9D6|nr:hypothetical protein [Rhizobium leguminosarum]